jgi:hypothetical protein
MDKNVAKKKMPTHITIAIAKNIFVLAKNIIDIVILIMRSINSTMNVPTSLGVVWKASPNLAVREPAG